MARKIICSERDIEDIISNVRSQLAFGRWSKGEVKISQPVGIDNRKASIFFTPVAWLKTASLINSFDTEVEWHGLVKRSESAQNSFTVYDILVPPHKVTGVTVTSDQKEFCDWFNGLSFDEVRDDKFHGHSHVNFSCFPSLTDNTYRDKIVSQLSTDPDDDSFYIFMIFNKKFNWTAEIYDVVNNVFYDSNDVNIETTLDSSTTVSSFISKAKTLAVEEKPEPPVKYYSKEVALGDLYKEKTDTKKKDKQSKKHFSDYDNIYDDSESEYLYHGSYN